MEIYNIESIPEELLQVVGGKARGLCRLANMGYDVPEAFVIREFTDTPEECSAIIEKYKDFGEGPVSVRSSASLEDGADFSAAGQFSTFLNITGGESLIQAVRDCIASLHNVTAENYSNSFLGNETGEMTVVVQRMLDPRSAGVIFTKAPMKPGFCLVEAVPGLGENLVSGKMSAQQFRVRGRVIENIPDHPYITNKEAVDLSAAGLKIEKAFGMSLDLEWAIDRKGKIWWLQARPITVEESVTLNELDCPLDVSHDVLTTGNIGEMMPGAVTPLNLSTNMYALDWGIRETYARFGACTRSQAPYSFIASYYNHMFFNMTNMYLACHSILGSTKDTMDQAICGHVLDGFPDNPMRDLPVLTRAANSLPFFKLVFSGEASKTGMKRVADGLKFDLTQDARGIYKQIIDKFDALKWAQFYHYCASYYSGGQSNILMMTAQKHFKDKNEMLSLIAGCLTQIEEFESASILRYMIQLSELILKDCPEAAGYDETQLKDYLDKAPADVAGLYSEFMERHGFRGIREPEIMSRPWRENPESFLLSLKSVIASSGEGSAREERPWTDYQKELLSHFLDPLLKKMVRGMVRRARKGVCCREYTKSRTIYVLDKFRQAYRQLAKLMVADGLLPDEDCIFFLLQDEVGKLLEGDRSYVKKALARRRMFPAQERLKFRYCQVGAPVPIVTSSENKNAIRLQGTPVSRGVATGIARIVRTEKDAAALQQGEIMVVESTDIGWTPFYNTVAGMVTEIGSALSHGIVVAREYALPAVVNVTDAMQLIHDGDTITLDGNKGLVLIDRKKK